MQSPSYQALPTFARAIWLTHHTDQMHAAEAAVEDSFTMPEALTHMREYHRQASIIAAATGIDPRPVA